DDACVAPTRDEPLLDAPGGGERRFQQAKGDARSTHTELWCGAARSIRGTRTEHGLRMRPCFSNHSLLVRRHEKQELRRGGLGKLQRTGAHIVFGHHPAAPRLTSKREK
ncbi:MAG TPA: hypothetical protein VGB55_01945, partial [Tepidisphaeraceae bacterium]